MDAEMFERNLPPYLASDLAAWKKGVAEGSRLLDCLWIDSAPLLNDFHRSFYKTYIAARHEALFG